MTLEMVSAVLAHFMLNEKLQKMGMLGCLLCIVGSTVIVLHAPQEKPLSSVEEIWQLALQPGMLLLEVLLFVSAIKMRILFCYARLMFLLPVLASSIHVVHCLDHRCSFLFDIVLCSSLWPD